MEIFLGERFKRAASGNQIHAITKKKKLIPTLIRFARRRSVYDPAPPGEDNNDAHHTQYVVTRKFMPSPFRTREVNCRQVWGKIVGTETLVLAIEPAKVNYQEENDNGDEHEPKMLSSPISIGRRASRIVVPRLGSSLYSNKKFVNVKTTAVWVIERRAENVSEVKLVTNLVDEGNLPLNVVNNGVNRSLKALSLLKYFYERNGLVVDKELRAAFVSKIPSCLPLVTAEHKKLVKEQIQQYGLEEKGWEYT